MLPGWRLLGRGFGLLIGGEGVGVLGFLVSGFWLLVSGCWRRGTFWGRGFIASSCWRGCAGLAVFAHGGGTFLYEPTTSLVAVSLSGVGFCTQQPYVTPLRGWSLFL